MSNHGIKDLKTISFKFSCIVYIFLGIWAIHYKNNCLVLRKSACPFGQVKTKMYLPVSPFFKNSLARASGLVLMLMPDYGLQLDLQPEILVHKQACFAQQAMLI